MAMMLSINGGKLVPAASVVIFHNEGEMSSPVAASIDHGHAVFFVDSVRDAEEFLNVLAQLGIQVKTLPKLVGTLGSQ